VEAAKVLPAKREDPARNPAPGSYLISDHHKSAF
jgi:hypothetical protein